MKKLIFSLGLISLMSLSFSQSIFGGNLIKNAGFDDGTPSVAGATVAVPNWTGNTTVGTYGISNWWEVPEGAWSSGTQFAGGGNLASNTISQTFTIDASDFATIDAGQANFNVNGWFGGWSTNNDNAVLNVTFKNSVGGDFRTIQIGGVSSADRNGVTSMLFREANGTLDIGTRSIVFDLAFTRTNGTYSDGSADTLAFTAEAVPEPMTLIALAAGAGLIARKRRNNKN